MQPSTTTTDEVGDAEPIVLRTGTIPRGGGSKQKRWLKFMVDDDEAQDLMQDAVVGPIRRDAKGLGKDTLVRPKESDVQVAANQVARAAYNSAMGLSARSVLPSPWTQGYDLSEVNGQEPREGQWDMDPSSVAVIDAGYNRTLEQLRRRQKKAPEKVLREAYVNAHAFMETTLEGAKDRTYDFTGRHDEISPTKGYSMPWIRSVYYELAIRGLDRLWAGLDTTRQTSNEHTLGDTIVIELNRRYGEVLNDLSDNELFKLEFLQTTQAFSTFIRNQADKGLKARNHPVRLIMLGSSLDQPTSKDVVRLTDDSELLVAESLFFGRQHSVVENLLYQSSDLEALRYFGASPGGVFQKAPMFAYKLDRVLITDTDVGGAPPLVLDSTIDNIPLGYRIKLPPAPRGYRRHNVLIQFISSSGVVSNTDEYGEGGEETLDAVLSVEIPDTGVFRLGGDRNARRVDQLPANIILFFSARSGSLDQPQQQSGTLPSHGIFDIRDTPAKKGAGPILAWQAMYDLTWLEWVSGDAGRMHPVHNEKFRRKLDDAYFRPWNNKAPPPEEEIEVMKEWEDARLDIHAHIQIVVELVATPEAIRDGRANRRTYTQRIPKTSRPVVFPYTKPIPSAAVLKRFDVAFSTTQRMRKQLPVVSMLPVAMVDTTNPSTNVVFQALVDDDDDLDGPDNSTDLEELFQSMQEHEQMEGSLARVPPETKPAEKEVESALAEESDHNIDLGFESEARQIHDELQQELERDTIDIGDCIDDDEEAEVDDMGMVSASE